MGGMKLNDAIQAFRGGNRDAYDVIHETYRRPLWAFLYVRTKSHADAEDLFNIVSMTVAQDIGQLKRAERMVPWVLSIAAHRLCDFYRRKELEAVPLDEVGRSMADAARSSERRLIRKQRRRHLRRCIGELPHPQQDYFALQFLAGLRQGEIANQYEIHINALKAQIFRAKTKLIRCLRRKGWSAGKRDRDSAKIPANKEAVPREETGRNSSLVGKPLPPSQVGRPEESAANPPFVRMSSRG